MAKHHAKFVTIWAVMAVASLDAAFPAAHKMRANRCSSIVTAESTAIVVAEDIRSTPREIVEIRDGYKYNPPFELIKRDYVPRYHYQQTPLMDKISAFISPMGDAPSNKSRTELFAADSYSAAQTYVDKHTVGRRLSNSEIDLLMRTVLNTPELLKEAQERYGAVADSEMMKLNNFDLNRYFWFIPEGAKEYKPARILDIHRSLSPDGILFLVEYVDGMNSDGVRLRKVQQLRQEEFATIQTHLGAMTREEAAQAFMDNLTPDEIQTIQLAESLNLKLFGYYSLERAPEIASRFAQTPMQVMNSRAYYAVHEHIINTFKNIDDLLLPSEKEQEVPNVLDVFARLDPKYVMQRFGGPRAKKTEFMWVITEDGQLKVIPALHIGNNLKPLNLRLASGRKIFAGGTFTMNSRGDLDIKLNADSYQQADLSWGADAAFQENNPNVNAFVQVVFGMQMGKKVASVNAEKLEAWIINREGNFDRFSGNWRESRFGSENFSYDSAETFYYDMGRRAQRSVKKNQKSLKWDMDKDIPLSIDGFARKMNSSDRDPLTRADWAHYVLGTSSNMAWGDIKTQYRRLASRFHPDKNPGDERAVKITQELNPAFEILKGMLEK